MGQFEQFMTQPDYRKDYVDSEHSQQLHGKVPYGETIDGFSLGCVKVRVSEQLRP